MRILRWLKRTFLDRPLSMAEINTIVGQAILADQRLVTVTGTKRRGGKKRARG